jgi:hypothetical protein
LPPKIILNKNSKSDNRGILSNLSPPPVIFAKKARGIVLATMPGEYFFLSPPQPPQKSGPFFYCKIQSLFDHKFFGKKLIFLKGFTVVFDQKITSSRKYLIKINKLLYVN